MVEDMLRNYKNLLMPRGQLLSYKQIGCVRMMRPEMVSDRPAKDEDLGAEAAGHRAQ